MIMPQPLAKPIRLKIPRNRIDAVIHDSFHDNPSGVSNYSAKVLDLHDGCILFHDVITVLACHDIVMGLHWHLKVQEALNRHLSDARDAPIYCVSRPRLALFSWKYNREPSAFELNSLIMFSANSDSDEENLEVFNHGFLRNAPETEEVMVSQISIAA
jgi:hypothetical protein